MGAPRFSYAANYPKTCQWCGAAFMAKRENASNCGAEACARAARRAYKQRRREQKTTPGAQG